MAIAHDVSGTWSARRGFAWAVRAFGVIVPFGLAFASGLVVTRLLPPPHGIGQRLSWWVLASAVALGVLRAGEICARRLLPLSTLLSMTLAFPDHAPSRLRVALQATMKQRLRALENDASDKTAQASAEHLLAMVAALSRHDRLTIGHSERTRAYAALLADELGLSPEDSTKFQWAALLHDIGKLDVPGTILNKPGTLDDDERAVIFGHPAAGEQRAAPLVAWLGPWANGIWEHHEKVDGTGYPLGLRGDQISFSGRLIAVCDSFEVMTAARTYKRTMSLAAGRAELVRCSGTQFDPQIVRAFLNISLGDARVITGPFAALAQLPHVAGWMSTTAGSVAAIGVVAGTMAIVVPPSDFVPRAAAATTFTTTTAVRGTPTVSAIPRAPASLPLTTSSSAIPATIAALTSSSTTTSASTATTSSPTTSTTTRSTTSSSTAVATTTQLLASRDHDRLSPVTAEGASFFANEDIYVFAMPPSGATAVSFSIDGVVLQTDDSAPFDMMGTNGGGKANKYKLPFAPGSLTVTVVTEFATGPSHITTATIFYDYAPGQGPAQ